MEISQLRDTFRAMDPMREEDELEDKLLTDDERYSKDFRDSVSSNQWVKIVTKSHDAGCDEESRYQAGWFPVEFASVLFAAQFCDDDTFIQQLWDYAKKGPFSKWCLRSPWHIAEVLPPGVEPPAKGWVD